MTVARNSQDLFVLWDLCRALPYVVDARNCPLVLRDIHR